MEYNYILYNFNRNILKLVDYCINELLYYQITHEPNSNEDYMTYGYEGREYYITINKDILTEHSLQYYFNVDLFVDLFWHKSGMEIRCIESNVYTYKFKIKTNPKRKNPLNEQNENEEQITNNTENKTSNYGMPEITW